MDIILTITGAVIAFLLSILMGLLASRKKKEVDKIKNTYEKVISEVSGSYIKDLATEAEPEYGKIYDELRLDYEKALRNMLAHSPGYVTESKIENRVNEKIKEIQMRVEHLETKIPEGSSLEKIESTREAILETNIESLSESIKRIEDTLLTKWDVAKVVFAILACLGGLITVIFVIINYISQRGG